MSDIRDLSHTIIPKSDQLNADTLLGGAITITVTDVRDNGDDQPIVVYFNGDNGRPYKPCKSMRKVLLFAWGKDGTKWIGRSMTLYTDPDVMFGGMKVGGIRISHMSHIERDISLALTATKGKKAQHMIRRLAQEAPAASNEQVEAARVQALNASRKGKKAFAEVWNGLPNTVRRALGQDFKANCLLAATGYDDAQAADQSASIAALARATERAEAKQAAAAAQPAPEPEPEPEQAASEPASDDDEDIFQVD